MTPQIIELLLLLIFLDLSCEDDHNNDCYYEFSALQSTQAVLNSGAHDILILIGKKKKKSRSNVRLSLMSSFHSARLFVPSPSFSAICKGAFRLLQPGSQAGSPLKCYLTCLSLSPPVHTLSRKQDHQSPSPPAWMSDILTCPLSWSRSGSSLCPICTQLLLSRIGVNVSSTLQSAANILA